MKKKPIAVKEPKPTLADNRKSHHPIETLGKEIHTGIHDLTIAVAGRCGSRGLYDIQRGRS